MNRILLHVECSKHFYELQQKCYEAPIKCSLKGDVFAIGKNHWNSIVNEQMNTIELCKKSFTQLMELSTIDLQKINFLFNLRIVQG